MIGIYKITNPKGKIYIGQTIDFERRVYQYEKLNCKEQPKLYNSLKKYGLDNHKIELIYKCDELDLTFFERYYQEIYKTTVDNNLNCFLVTTLDKTGKHCDETKAKMSQSAKGKKKNPEHIAKLPQNQKGYKAKPRSESFKVNQSLNNGRNRKVYQYEKDGTFVKEWFNISEAERQLGHKNISYAALGKLKTCGGFKWSYTKF
jgi:group I intron endonuclease